MISLKTHSILDYVGAVALILCPFVFGFADLETARNVFMICGFTLILYSLFTNYQFSAFRLIPLGVHMTLDVMTGAFLIIAPWVLNYRVFLTPGQEFLHYIVGFGVFALVGITSEKTETDKREHGIRLDQRQTVSPRF